jgi:hypothetical protein
VRFVTDVFAPPPVIDDRDDGGPGRSTMQLVLGLVAALLLVVGVAAVIAGKDDGDTHLDAAALLSNAPDAVRDAGSARVAMSMTAHATGTEISFRGDGVTEFRTGRAHFTMSVMGSKVEIISDGSTMYLHTDGMPGSSKPWVSAPVSQLQGQTSFGSVDSAAGFLDALRGIGANSIQQLETAEVNGVEATHFRTSISIADALAAAPEAQRAQAEASLQQLEALGASRMPVDVWVTDDGLPVRQVMTFDAKSGGIMPAVSVELRVDLSDFGKPVDVDVPPPDQVQAIDPTQIGSMFGGTGPLTTS